MDRAVGIRLMALYGPAVLVAIPWALNPLPRRRAAAAFLAVAWNVPALILVNMLALRFGWWTFAAPPAAIADVPVDLLLGWVVLWGAVPVILMQRLPLVMVVAILAGVDLVTMPLMAPVLRLGDHWLLGEVLALTLALVPAQLLARWTEQDRRLEVRALLQVIAFSSTVLWVLPLLVLGGDQSRWTPLVAHSGLPLQLVLMVGLIGVSAVQEFAIRGRGTPIPFDPPKRLVTSGPYAYVANPMQLSVALVLVAWGVILQSFEIVLGGFMSVVYSAGLAATDERADLSERFGEPWRAYRQRVKAWLPRWRPYHPAADAEAVALPARLYVAYACEPCSEVARWFNSRSPRGLEVVPAELHPARDLTRITYDPGDGSADDVGVAAVARALEHINFGWALLGWFLRAPLVAPALQLLVDASGGEARRVRRAPNPDSIICGPRNMI